MTDLQILEMIYPEQIWLEVSEKLKEDAWKRSQNHSNTTAKYNAYLNDICLNTFLPWLKDYLSQDQLEIRIFQESSLSSIWEFINGTLIELGKTRLVLLAFITDIDELCIPQEWVDIPEWRADYYLAVQLNLNEIESSWMRIEGYTNYQKIKTKENYEKGDRAYYLAQKYLTEDLTILLEELNTSYLIERETTTTLLLENLKELLEQLSNPSISSPRLAVEFEQWIALFSNEEFRQNLYHRRLKSIQQFSEIKNPPINISELSEVMQWLYQMLNSICEIVEPLVDIKSEQPIPGFLHEPSAIMGFIGTNQIRLNSSLSEQEVFLNIVLIPAKHEPEIIDILIEVRPTDERKTLPPKLKMMALDRNQMVILCAQAENNDRNLGFEFCRKLQEPFSIKLVLHDVEYFQTYSSLKN